MRATRARIFSPCRSSSTTTTRDASCIMRVCSTAARSTPSATWKAGCTPSRGKFASISNPTRRSPSFSASICTIWATRWAAWRAMCAWPTSSTSTRAASSGTTWTRRSGTPTRLAAACWATAATLRTATPITTSAATALSTPTVPRSPPCRTCATGTTPPPAAPPTMPATLQPPPGRTATRPKHRPPASPVR